MSMTLEELAAFLNPPKIVIPMYDVDDDQDICQLMARNDEDVLKEWKKRSEASKKVKDIILVVDDDTGIAEYMERLEDGSFARIKVEVED